MRFGKINNYIIIGGGRLVAYLCKDLINKNISFSIFTAPRHLDDIIDNEETTFKDFFINNEIPFFVSKNINSDTEFLNQLNNNCLVIGIGQAWTVDYMIIDKLNGRFVDFMGIALPQNRGGAHYTWQILSQNKLGGCNIETVDKYSRQGKRDTGILIKSLSYFFPSSANTPMDYFEYAVDKELEFLNEFIIEVENNFQFNLIHVNENYSTYFPRLNTLKNAYIDWRWSSEEIKRFIDAFDKPYPGAGTMIEEKLVRIRGVQLIKTDGFFHPFQVGLIYRIVDDKLFVASKEGTLIISEVKNEKNNLINSELECGMRFHTPQNLIEKGLTTKIDL